MKISVIVPAFNEEKLLGATLQNLQVSLTAFTARGWETEVIVCDNNSTDRTQEIARNAGAKVVFEPENQIARARNTGAAAATGDWIIFVDADTHPSRELFADVADAIAAGKCIAGGVTVCLDEPNLLGKIIVFIWNCLSRWRRWMPGPFHFCETAVFRKLGGCNTILYSSEDVDLSIRLKRYGRTIGRTVVILHDHPVVTSARKLKLYKTWDYVRFMAKTVFTGGKTLTDKKECHTWYDGRR